jgi:hypothetical protein
LYDFLTTHVAREGNKSPFTTNQSRPVGGEIMQRHHLDYVDKGIVGLLIPQANTTAEPELNLLFGSALTMLTGRLVSGIDVNKVTARVAQFLSDLHPGVILGTAADPDRLQLKE